MESEGPDSDSSWAEAEAHGTEKPLAPGLYLVATPIGNLEDITLRALRVLRTADLLLCEDTRQTQKLLNHFSIRTPAVSYHLHNELGRANEMVARLQVGERIAVVSDAGTPGIADPGQAIVRAAIAAGVPVFPVPGANAAISALVGSGLPADGFTFRGFLPSKAGERRSTLETLFGQLKGAAEPLTQIFYETPHRIIEALADVEAVFGAGQAIVVARELTKLNEEFLRGEVSVVRAELEKRPSVRGEMVLMLGGVLRQQDAARTTSIAEAVQARMRDAKVDEKEALKQVARERGLGKSEAYREWQRTKNRHR